MMRYVSTAMMLLGLVSIVASYRTSTKVTVAQEWDEAKVAVSDELQYTTHEGMSADNLDEEDLQRRLAKLAILQKEQDDILKSRLRQQRWLRHGGQLLTGMGLAMYAWQVAKSSNA